MAENYSQAVFYTIYLITQIEQNGPLRRKIA